MGPLDSSLRSSYTRGINERPVQHPSARSTDRRRSPCIIFRDPIGRPPSDRRDSAVYTSPLCDVAPYARNLEQQLGVDALSALEYAGRKGV